VTNKNLAWIISSGAAGSVLVILSLFQLSIPSERNSMRDVSPQCLVRGDQCEKVAETRILAEPENTLSNLAYLIAGIGILVRTLRAGFDRTRVPQLMVGVAFCFLAVCSAYYHATLNNIHLVGRLPKCNPDAPALSQYLDIVGVYLALISIICFGFDRLLRKRIELGAYSVLAILIATFVALVFWIIPAAGAPSESRPVMTGVLIWVIVGAWAATIGFMIRGQPSGWVVWTIWALMLIFIAGFSAAMRIMFHYDSDLVFPVLVGILVGVTTLNLVLPSSPTTGAFQLSLAEIGLTLSAFVVGIVLRVSDGGKTVDYIFQPKPLCSPEALVQPHAVWHVMSALALLLTFDLIEKSVAGNVPDYNGPVLLPTSGSIVSWLARPGSILGRRLATLIMNIGFSLATLMFCIVVLLHFSPLSVLALLPLCTATYLWIVSYMNLPSSANSKL